MVFWVFGSKLWPKEWPLKNNKKNPQDNLKFHNTFVTAGFARLSLLKWNRKGTAFAGIIQEHRVFVWLPVRWMNVWPLKSHTGDGMIETHDVPITALLRRFSRWQWAASRCGGSPFSHIILGSAHEVQVRRRKPQGNSALFSSALLSQSVTHENVSVCYLRCFPSSVCIILSLNVQGGCWPWWGRGGGVDSVIVWLLWSASVPPPHAPAIGSASLIY